ncbi:MAG: glycerol-3-phosphate 1-O-acyltransferase PlsY [Eubacteriales bacterium]
MNNFWIYIVIALVCYIIGSVSPAVFLSKKFAGYDIREKGSKNAGSTNVFRVMGAKFGIINFILDLLKGLLPTLLAKYIAIKLGLNLDIAMVCAAGAVVLGHAFPIFSHFKGGKCVASSAGLLIAFNPVFTICLIVLAIISIIITRYVSAASITVFLLYPIAAWIFPMANGFTEYYSLTFRIFLSCLGVLILFLHRENIVRLLKGNEKPLFQKKDKEKQEQE